MMVKGFEAVKSIPCRKGLVVEILGSTDKSGSNENSKTVIREFSPNKINITPRNNRI